MKTSNYFMLFSRSQAVKFLHANFSNFVLIILLGSASLFSVEVSAQNANTSEKTNCCEDALTKNNQMSALIVKHIENYAKQVKSDWGIPGMAFSFIKDGQIIYAGGFGVKDISKSDSDKNNLIDENTVFQIGSVSKSFTAAVMASLVDEGKIKWEDTVKNILPDFRMYDKWVEENIQVKDIMTHRTGLKGQMGTYIPNMGYSRDDVYKMIALMKPKYSFRGGYEYNNITFIIAQKIIEKLSGKTWEENVYERIFNPLGMSASSLNEDGFKSSANVAVPHDNGYVIKKGAVGKLDSIIVKRKEYLSLTDSVYATPIYGEEQALHWLTVIGPAGSVNSTVTDLVKYAQFHLNNGNVPLGGFSFKVPELQNNSSIVNTPLKTKEVISRKNMEYLHRGQTITSQDSTRTTLYGQCWFIEQNNRYRLYFHTGTTWGFTTLVAYVPELKLGMAILVNSEASSSPRYAIMRRLIDLYLINSVHSSGKECSVQSEAEHSSCPNCENSSTSLNEFLGNKLRDYNAEYLGEWAQSGRESALKASLKVPQQRDSAPDYNKLAGVYDKGNLFGKATVSLENDTLYITVGPLGWKHKLIHRNGTKFSFRSDGHEFPVNFIYKEKRGKAKKELSSKELKKRKIIGLDIDFGYGEDFGIWNKKN